MREGRGYLELRGELTGELVESAPPSQFSQVHVMVMPKMPGVPLIEGLY